MGCTLSPLHASTPYLTLYAAQGYLQLHQGDYCVSVYACSMIKLVGMSHITTLMGQPWDILILIRVD